MTFSRMACTARDVESLRTGTLPLLRAIFRSDSTIIWLNDRDNTIVEPREINVQPHLFPLYRDYFYRKNPLDPVNLRSFSGTSITMEQVVPFSEFRKTEYYNDFIRPQKIRRQMVVYIRAGDRLASVICTHRNSDRRFRKDDRLAGKIVASHLSAALERIDLIQEVQRRGGFFEMVLDSAEVGFAVLGLEKRLLFINKKAARICSRIKKEALADHDLEAAESLLPPSILADCGALEEGRRKSRDPGLEAPPVKERVLPVSAFEKCRFRSRLVSQGLTGFNRPLFLISMEPLPPAPRFDRSALKPAFNLTEREAEIVSHIFKGWTNAQIAEGLFISEGTVKNHLRNIYGKVKVKTRTALVHRVLSL